MAIPAISAYSPPGPTNVYPVGYDGVAQARLLIDFARNPKDFQVNDYVTITPMTKMVGIYPVFLPTDDIRVLFADGSDSLWPDGVPSGANNTFLQGPRRTNVQYEIKRYKREGRLGWLTRDQSDFDEVKLWQDMLASQAMTYRTIYTLAKGLDTANYATNHTGTATALGGGLWTAGTVVAPYIQQTLQSVRERITLDTNGKIKLKDLRVIVSPTLASGMARSQEIRAYLSNQANSLAVIKGATPDADDDWSLPNPIYGFAPIIERSPKVTTKPNQLASDYTDGTPAFCMDSQKALIVARPGSLVSEGGGINFSTLQLLEFKKNAFGTYVEDLGEREQATYIRVDDFFETIVAAPQSGFVVTSVSTL